MRTRSLGLPITLAILGILLYQVFQTISPVYADSGTKLIQEQTDEYVPHNNAEINQAETTSSFRIAVIRRGEKLTTTANSEESTQFATDTNAPATQQTNETQAVSNVSSSENNGVGRSSSLDQFAAEVRAQGMNGIWADGLFAFRFYTTEWGVVPGASNTASYSSAQGYHGYFIHNYLGGNRLYNVGSGTMVAVIRQDSIEWYRIDGVHRFAGTSTGSGCGYTEPFSDWNGGNSYSAMDLISTYYTSPFVIQTCLCTGEKSGILILTGS